MSVLDFVLIIGFVCFVLLLVSELVGMLIEWRAHRENQIRAKQWEAYREMFKAQGKVREIHLPHIEG